MIEYLCFELCKPDKRSRFIEIEVDEEGVYLTTAYGNQGMYLEDAFVRYHSPIQLAWLISGLLKDLKISTWPKAIPEDYVPEKHLIGCDVDAWSLDYREQGKKRTRHIHGKGSFPDTPPYEGFLECIDHIAPERDWLKWLNESENT
ncbi:MAG: hypothetical protein IKD94_05370 [Erysipelotrichaceae bacterium]|nr:hypothetical protein [Erysipelotrichaceae bacterium]